MTNDTRTDLPPDDVVDLSPAELARRVYALFYNKRTGLVLILAMVVLTLMGVLFSQAPAGIRDDPAAYSAWLEAVRPRYRGWTDVLSALGVFRMFSSIPFLLVTSLLALSILACSAHRVPRLWAAATRPHTHVTESFFDHGRLHRTVAVREPPEEATRRVTELLRARRFRILEDPHGPGQNLYADRFRFAPFGTVVAHVAFVLILVGVLVTSTFGFEDSQFTVTVGTTAEVGHGTGLALELTAFRDEYHPDGTPKDYASDVVLYEDGQQVAATTIRVNDPLHHGGISFNQAFFGVAAEVTATDPEGGVLFADGVPLRWTTTDGLYSYGRFTLPGLEVYVITAASGQADRDIAPGEARFEIYPQGGDTLVASELVAQGASTTVNGISYTFERERQYSGLIVSRDPGAPWVWVGGALLVLGSCAAMFFRHRRVWVRVRPAAGGSEVRLASPDRPDPTFESTFHEVVGALAGSPGRKAGESDA